MNDSIKEKLKDEELDNVVGGNFDENQHILSVLAGIDPAGVKEFTQNWDQGDETRKGTLATGLIRLLKKNLKGTNLDVSFDLSPDKVHNIYFVNGKKASHEEFIQELEKIPTWEIV